MSVVGWFFESFDGIGFIDFYKVGLILKILMFLKILMNFVIFDGFDGFEILKILRFWIL